MKVLKNCKLVADLTEGWQSETADIVIENHVIKEILPRGGEYTDCQVMDLRGKTLLPGLIDAHVHLFMGKDNGWDRTDRLAFPGQTVLDCLRYAQFLLDLGYTTVRDCGDEVNYPVFAVRNAIDAGEITGPTIKGTGVTIAPRTPGFQSFEFMLNYADTPEEMRKAVRKQFAAGADCIKLYGTGSMMVEDSIPGRRIMAVDEIKEAVAMADLRGSYCACHCHGAEAIEVMAENGVRTIEHATFITEKACRILDGKKDQGIVLTVGCTTEEMNRLDGYGEAAIERFRQINAQRNICLMNAYENHNVLIGWGTDIAMVNLKAYPHIEWLERTRMGMQPLDLLKQATINSAILIGMEDKIGTVKVGKWADFVVVDGDPVQDITVMYTKPVHVIKKGKVIR